MKNRIDDNETRENRYIDNEDMKDKEDIEDREYMEDV